MRVVPASSFRSTVRCGRRKAIREFLRRDKRQPASLPIELPSLPCPPPQPHLEGTARMSILCNAPAISPRPAGKADGKAGCLGVHQLFVAGLREHGSAINNEFHLLPGSREHLVPHAQNRAWPFSGAIRPIIPTRAAPRRRILAVNPMSRTPLYITRMLCAPFIPVNDCAANRDAAITSMRLILRHVAATKRA